MCEVMFLIINFNVNIVCSLYSVSDEDLKVSLKFLNNIPSIAKLSRLNCLPRSYCLISIISVLFLVISY